MAAEDGAKFLGDLEDWIAVGVHQRHAAEQAQRTLGDNIWLQVKLLELLEGESE